jgi:intein-encoded DNA endonuclease-like protein
MRGDKYTTEIVNLYSQGLVPKQIASSLNITSYDVWAVLEKNNIPRNNLANEQLEYRNKVKEMYEQGMSTFAIAKTFGKEHTGVSKLLNRMGIAIRNSTERNKKHTFDENYFDVIDTEEKAYWLGFLAADGNVSKTKQGSPSITLGLAIKDLDHLEKFKKALVCTQPIGLYDAKLKHKIFPSCKLSIRSKVMAESLSKYHIIPKKSHTVQFPTIDESLHRHYIRGYFDGDGCFTQDKGQIVFSITSNKTILEQIQNVLIKECNIKKIKIHSRDEITPTGVFTYKGNKQMVRIANYLYKDSGISLGRKKEKVAHLL